MLTRAAPPSGFIEPCLSSAADHLPSGPDWVHEIKHDGYRIMARRVWLFGFAEKQPRPLYEPVRFRRVLPGGPNCEFEVHETAVDRKEIVSVE